MTSSENGGKSITVSPTFAVAFVLGLLGVGGFGGLSVKETASASHVQADHDQLTRMAVELATLKDNLQQFRLDTQLRLDKFDKRAEDTNNLVRRLLYGPKAAVREREEPAEAVK